MKKLFIGICTASLLILPAIALAQTSSGGNAPPTSSGGNTMPVSSTGFARIDNPLGVSSFCGLVKALLGAAIQIGIPIAVLFIVYAGFKFILARGKAEKLTEARRNMLNVIIGIAIFLGAWLLAQVIANTVSQLGQGSGSPALTSCR